MPNSPAAAIPKPLTNAGTSIVATCPSTAIATRIGIPFDDHPWGWARGFYPGSHSRESTNGAAATFDETRA